MSRLWLLTVVSALRLVAADPLYDAARDKLDRIPSKPI